MKISIKIPATEVYTFDVDTNAFQQCIRDGISPVKLSEIDDEKNLLFAYPLFSLKNIELTLDDEVIGIDAPEWQDKYKLALEKYEDLYPEDPYQDEGSKLTKIQLSQTDDEPQFPEFYTVILKKTSAYSLYELTIDREFDFSQIGLNLEIIFLKKGWTKADRLVGTSFLLWR